jgi:hypothetical protein
MKRKHKYPAGQIVRILKSPDIRESFWGKYAYITSHVVSTSAYKHGEPEYDVVIQGCPASKCRVFQKEIKEVE